MNPKVYDMLDKPILRVFLDTSVYISGLVSDTGASDAVLYAAEAGAFQLFFSSGISKEARRTFIDKFHEPRLFDRFQKLIESIEPVMIEASEKDVFKAARFCRDKEDAPILAAAIKSSIRYFITLDKKAFKKNLTKKEVGFKVINPGEFMRIFRKIIGDKGYFD